MERTPDLGAVMAWRLVPANFYQRDNTSAFMVLGDPVETEFFRLRRGVQPERVLTGSWQADEGTGSSVEDGSARGNAMVLSEVQWSEGFRGGSALQFNGGAGQGGSRAWVSNETYQVLPPSGQPFSVSMWFNPTMLTAVWRGLCGTAANGQPGWRLALRSPGPGTNELAFASVGAEESLGLTGRTLLLPGQWRQVTVAYDGETGRLYLDGELLAQGSGGVPVGNSPVYFGGGLDGCESFLGSLDDLRTYSNALTAEQVALAGEWHFEEEQELIDSSPHQLHATLSDPLARVAGRTGAGIDLSRGQVTIDNSDQLVLPPTGAEFSISFWIYPNSLSDAGLMTCADGSSAGWSLALEAASQGSVFVHWFATNSGGTLDLRAPVDLRSGEWSKLDLTSNGGIATLYVDGRRVLSKSGSVRGSGVPLLVGGQGAGVGFDGILDELKVYRKERDPDEIGPVGEVMWETVWMNTTTNLVLKGFGPAGKPLTFSLADAIAPTNGVITHVPGSSTVTYQALGRKGPDAFAYTVSDGEFTSAPVTVVLSVVRPIWLAPEGGPVQPRDGTSPDRAWVAGPAQALDAILSTNIYYDCFYYAPGEYHTSGYKYEQRGTARPGCKHIGSGAEGPGSTTLRLVNAKDSTGEGIIFGLPSLVGFCHGFEVHHMTLDCNAENNPSYSQGELTTLVIPLATTSRVDTVTLRWSDGGIPSTGWIPGRGGYSWRLGRAIEFSLCTRRFENGSYITNCVSVTTTGRVDVVPVGVPTDQIILLLERRPFGVDFISLEEIEVSGGQVSLPSATAPGVSESQLASIDSRYSILRAVDGNLGSAWASGAEAEVEIVLPLRSNTLIREINLDWNCQTVADVGRLGPAATYTVWARDPETQAIYEVPSVRHPRGVFGNELITFGTPESSLPISTDRVILVLTSRELGVDYYSLREISLRYGPAVVGLNLPTASSALAWSGVHSSFLVVFDKAPSTRWACRTQGMIGAFEVGGNNLKFTHLRVIGFGSKAGREGFPFGIRTPLPVQGPPTQFGNVLVEDCILTQPATNNTGGLTAVSMLRYPPHDLTNAVVRRCTVNGVQARFTYSHGFSAVHVENCLVEGCDNGVYFEPDRNSIDAVGEVLVRSNRFENVQRGVYLLMHPGARFDSITCLDNEFALKTASGFGFGICDTCSAGESGTVTNITVLGNLIRYVDWLPRPSHPEGGLFYSNIHHGMFGNNLIALGTQNGLRLRSCPAGLIPPTVIPEQCLPQGAELWVPQEPSYPPCLDPVLPGYDRVWFNNRDLSNNLLPVRYQRDGVDGLASDQQWP